MVEPRSCNRVRSIVSSPFADVAVEDRVGELRGGGNNSCELAREENPLALEG